jgi:hypothetical protein
MVHRTSSRSARATLCNCVLERKKEGKDTGNHRRLPNQGAGVLSRPPLSGQPLLFAVVLSQRGHISSMLMSGREQV